MSSEDQQKTTLPLPPGTELPAFQAAGHKFGTKPGILIHSASRDILKPITDARGELERQFYEDLFRDDPPPADECITRLRRFVSTYNGLFIDPSTGTRYIRLENATLHLGPNPSVMDIKMGQITYEPGASETKKKSELGKYQHAMVMGFRILGQHVFDRRTKQYISRDKHYGTNIKEDNAVQALLDFFQHDHCTVHLFRRQLADITEWFTIHNHHRWAFISSSLFFAYSQLPDDAEEKADAALAKHIEEHRGLCSCPSSSSSCPRPTVMLKMIDFAHVLPNSTSQLDDNYLFGLMKLQSVLEAAEGQLALRK